MFRALLGSQKQEGIVVSFVADQYGTIKVIAVVDKKLTQWRLEQVTFDGWL